MSSKQERDNISEKGDFYITCPKCDDIVYITKVKCALFLHGYNTKTGKALNPHSKPYYVDKIRREGHLIGCGSQFRIKIGEDGSLVYEQGSLCEQATLVSEQP